MSPIHDACPQVDRDERFQAFLDWARNTDLDIMLWHVQELSRGRTDPFHIPARVQQLYWDVARAENAPATWSEVLTLIAQVQQEHEAKVRV